MIEHHDINPLDIGTIALIQLANKFFTYIQEESITIQCKDGRSFTASTFGRFINILKIENEVISSMVFTWHKDGEVIYHINPSKE